MSSGTIEYDWAQTEEKILVDMIRADNQNRPLTAEMISFGLPTQLTPTEELTYNTTVLVSATTVAPFSGSQQHRYHRVPITDFVYPGVTNLNFILQDQSTVADVLDILNERLGINLIEERVDFVYPTEPGPVTLTISSTSLCYYGAIELMFADKVWELDEVISNKHFDGFTF